MFVYNGRDEAKARQKRKPQEEEARLLAAALQGRSFRRQRGNNNGNKGNRNLHQSRPKDYCNKTKILEKRMPCDPEKGTTTATKGKSNQSGAEQK